MSKTIKQISETEVLSTLCDECYVYRFNVSNGTSTDLTSKAIKTITKDFNDQNYLYFTISE